MSDADTITQIVDEGLTTVAALKKLDDGGGEKLTEFYLGLAPKLAGLTAEQLTFMIVGLFDTGGTLLVKLLEASS